ncbi:MAG: amidohydrolase family protein [Thermoleophilia bacterium]|nr:amidohydrolase family protein [Thermoleophilia bacterium]
MEIGGWNVLLCADLVLPISSPPFPEGALLIAEGVVRVMGPAAELRARYPGEETREFPGCVLLPGLVNVHTHLEYSAFRGFTRPSGFGSWMLSLLLARRKLDTEDYVASALWGAYECMRSGVTSVADTSHDGWTVARAAVPAGLRARVYLELFGIDDAHLPVTMRRLETGLERLRDECGAMAAGAAARGLAAGGGGPLVEAGLSPHAPYTVSARLYREAARFARRAGLRMATHVAESQAEVRLFLQGGGAIAHAYRVAGLWKGRRWSPPRVSPVRYLDGTGALGPDMLVVHAVQVDDEDIALLAAARTPVAHCPRSNLRLRCGGAPVAEMRAAGLTIGLGTDSLASNDSLDMFAEMRAALAVSKERAAGAGAPSGLGGATSIPAPLTPAEVLRMATLDGARALGWEELIGSLEVGKRADVIAVRLGGGGAAPQPHRRPPGPHSIEGDPTGVLVQSATADDVRMTMIDGRVVFDGARMPVGVVERIDAARERLGLAPL